jgi:hypothetical protein
MSNKIDERRAERLLSAIAMPRRVESIRAIDKNIANILDGSVECRRGRERISAA